HSMPTGSSVSPDAGTSVPGPSAVFSTSRHDGPPAALSGIGGPKMLTQRPLGQSASFTHGRLTSAKQRRSASSGTVSRQVPQELSSAAEQSTARSSERPCGKGVLKLMPTDPRSRSVAGPSMAKLMRLGQQIADGDGSAPEE